MTQENKAIVARSDSPLEERLKEQFLVGLSGDETIYAEFLKTAAKIIRSNLRKTIPGSSSYSKDLLEDLVQDVLLSVHQKRHTYRSEYPILPWLFAIARHRWIDVARMLSVRPKLLNWDETEWQEIPDTEQVERVERIEKEGEAVKQVNELFEILNSPSLGFATAVKSEGVDLSLHGVGTRKATLFAVKVYHAAFYATKNLKSLEAVLSDPDLKRLELKYLRNFGLEDTQEAWIYQFRESSGLKPEELEPSLGKLISMQTPIREGDVHRFDFNKSKVTFYINGENRGDIESDLFRKALLTIFFGSNPPTKELQRGLYVGIGTQ